MGRFGRRRRGPTARRPSRRRPVPVRADEIVDESVEVPQRILGDLVRDVAEIVGVVGGVERKLGPGDGRVADVLVDGEPAEPTPAGAHPAHERQQLRRGEVPVGRPGGLDPRALLRLIQRVVKISASRGEHALHPVEQLDRGVDVDRLAGVGTLGTLGTPVDDAEVDEVRGVLLRHLDRGGDEDSTSAESLPPTEPSASAPEFADANDSSIKSPAARSAVPNMSRYLWTSPVALKCPSRCAWW